MQKHKMEIIPNKSEPELEVRIKGLILVSYLFAI